MYLFLKLEFNVTYKNIQKQLSNEMQIQLSNVVQIQKYSGGNGTKRAQPAEILETTEERRSRRKSSAS